MGSWIDAIEVIAPPEGFSGYLARLKADIGEGLRRDEAIHVFGPAARVKAEPFLTNLIEYL